jgi:hypothetical protein
MCRPWVGVFGLGAALLATFGCKTGAPDVSSTLLTVVGWKKTEPNLKPPPQPEEFAVPPEDDRRFSDYQSYPPETLKEDLMKKNHKDPQDGSPGGSGSHFGAGSGMGH